MKTIGIFVVALSVFLVFLTAQAQPAKTWRTGQTASYGAGDDGDLKRGVSWPSPRFTDNGDGTVTDRLTGLMWLKDADCMASNYPDFDVDGTTGDGLVTWQHALDFVGGINSGAYPNCGANYDDWRLPNRKELFSLIDYSRYNPALLQRHSFVNVQSGGFWSATTCANYTGGAWYVTMYFGLVYKSPKFQKMCVWPVRAGQGGEVGDLTISYPNGGEVLNKGQYYTIIWDSDDVTGNIQIDLYKGGSDPENMLLQLAAATENDGEYPFNPPHYFAPGDDYFIGISAEEGTIWDFSDSSFTIQNIEQSLPEHFSFLPIDSPQSVDIPFSVTITAIDEIGGTATGFNGEVSLSSNIGCVSPCNVCLENGQKTLSVTLCDQGRARLSCNSYGVSGYSGYFTVEGSGPCQGTVSGKVVDHNDNARCIRSRSHPIRFAGSAG